MEVSRASWRRAPRGFEAGVDWRPAPGVQLDLTAYDNRVRQAIANVTIAANLRERRNIDAVRARGIEAAARVTLGALEWDGALSWTDARMEGSGASAALTGKRPAQVPEWAASTTLAWRWGQGGLLAGTVRHPSAQFEDDLGIDALPAATTLDLWANVPLSGRASLILRAENVTDAEVWTRNQGGSIDLGAPRTLWAGLRFSIGR